MPQPGKQRFVSWGWTMLGHWAERHGFSRGQGPQVWGMCFYDLKNAAN